VLNVKQTDNTGILRAAKIARLCNNASSATEVALLRWVEKILSTDNNNDDRIKEYEFDQTLKRMTTIYPAVQDGHALLLTKGAPEQVLPLCRHILFDGQDCDMTNEQMRAVQDEVAHMASQGLRVIALADRVADNRQALPREEAECNLTFVGLLGIMDPPRDDVAEAMVTLKDAGISTVMVTGDNPLTAYHVAQMVGLIDQKLSFEQAVITGNELEQLENPTPAFLERLHRVRVFARVTPQHKAQIVGAMRQAGFIVGMTGDGVNDAIALKESDIGFAMGNGTDVAREASDVVLMDSRFGTIPNAVEEGRNVIHRIRLYLSYILSGNGCEVGAFIVAYILGMDIPLTALVLLVINFATDSFPALAMAFEPGESDVMKKPPRERGTPFINRVMWTHIGVQTVAATFIIMGVYYYCLEVVGTSLEVARSAAFMTYIFQKLYRAFTARSMTKNIWEIGLFRNLYSVGAVVISFSIALFCVVVPGVNTAMGLAVPAGSLWLLAALIGFVAPIAEELTKLYLKQSKQLKAILVEG
jgi:Ca2+-transporting ATPase